MNKKYIVTLTDDERRQLLALVNHGKKAAQRIRRAWVLLQADSGPSGPSWPDERIREAYAVGLVTIYRVRQAFVEEGFDAALARRPKTRHRHRRLDGDQEARLIALACSEPPPGRRRWTLRLLANKLVELGHGARVCPETVRQTLKKTNSSRTW